MSDMKIGDIGVLQNIKAPKSHYNGMIAEIIDYLNVGDVFRDLDTGKLLRSCCNGFIIKTIDIPATIIKPDQIRPLSDPDAHNRTHEKELELT